MIIKEDIFEIFHKYDYINPSEKERKIYDNNIIAKKILNNEYLCMIIINDELKTIKFEIRNYNYKRLHKQKKTCCYLINITEFLSIYKRDNDLKCFFNLVEGNCINELNKIENIN
jgi:hypothetical protein